MKSYAVRAAAEAARGAAPMPATTAWSVSWGAVVIGALAALAFAFLAGLIGITLGASQLSQGEVTRPFGFWSMAYTVAAAFFAFVVGGWLAGKMSGERLSETTSLHGVIAWLLCLPALVTLLALGGGPYLGAWYGGLAGLSGRSSLAAASDIRPAAEPAGRAGAPAVAAPTARARAEAREGRNAALGGLTALVLGLAGSVLGGWMASGEPMSIRYRRRGGPAHRP